MDTRQSNGMIFRGHFREDEKRIPDPGDPGFDPSGLFDTIQE
jgi:hypothetical protein